MKGYYLWRIIGLAFIFFNTIVIYGNTHNAFEALNMCVLLFAPFICGANSVDSKASKASNAEGGE